MKTYYCQVVLFSMLGLAGCFSSTLSSMERKVVAAAAAVQSSAERVSALTFPGRAATFLPSGSLSLHRSYLLFWSHVVLAGGPLPANKQEDDLLRQAVYYQAEQILPCPIADCHLVMMGEITLAYRNLLSHIRMAHISKKA